MGAGNAGGGAVILDVAGKVVIDGALSANGACSTSRGGGGSGGSVWIKGGEIRGKGTVSADGGDAGSAGYSGGGGGGRIAFDTPVDAFAGIIRAQGKPGTYFERGRHGTFNFKPDPGRDLVVTNDIALPPGTNWVFKSLTVANGASFEIQSTPGTSAESYTNEVASRLRCLGDVLVVAGSRLSADGLGYLCRQGPGAGGGDATGSSGGGHGGAGGFSRVSAGGVYGVAEAPGRLGSGGGGKSNGGGALILDVGGTMHVMGEITAQGDTLGQKDGGGSGGSIWIKARRIEGGGSLVASGGSGGYLMDSRGGGGGGGRIAIEVTTDRFTGEQPGLYSAYAGASNGSVVVAGGDGGLAEDGTAGTFYLARPVGTSVIIR